MGRKEELQTEATEILDDIKFFRNILLGVLSGLVGILFALSQKKLLLNSFIDILVLSGIIVSVFLMVVIRINKKKLQVIKKNLRREK